MLAVGVKGLQLITGVQWLAEMFNGVALVGAVSFALSRQRLAEGRAARRTDDLVPQVPDSGRSPAQESAPVPLGAGDGG